MRHIPMEGKKFGRLLVVERHSNNKGRQVMWLCFCDCGKSVVVNGRNLRSNISKSCGCLNSELKSERFKKLKTIHGFSGTSTYRTWGSMIQRCCNPLNKNYKDYGGRGIEVCNRWKTFKGFLDDMGLRPSKELTLERINNNGNYELGNCCWVTRKEQANNRRKDNDWKKGLRRKTVQKGQGGKSYE